jgi:hypothetical protein
MAFSVSPSVIVREVDASAAVPAIATPPAAIAGVFNWGPTNEAILISSEDELVSRFGKPSNDNYETFFVAADYLAYANAIWVARADNGATKAHSDTAIDVSLQGNTTTTSSAFEALHPGTLGNSLSVVWSGSAGYEQTIYEVGGVDGSHPFGNTAVSNTLDFNSGASAETALYFRVEVADKIADGLIEAGSLIEVGNDGIGYFNLTVAEFTETSLDINGDETTNEVDIAGYDYTIRTVEKYLGSADNWSQVRLRVKYKYGELYEGAPAAGNYHITVLDRDGGITGTSGTVLETYSDVSITNTDQTADGRTKYYQTLIENKSAYIALRSATSFENSGTGITIQNMGNPGSQIGFDVVDEEYTVAAAVAVNGSSESSLSLSGLATAYDLFKNSNEIDVSFVLTGKNDDNGVVANYVIGNVAEYRKDCVAFVSPSKEASVDSAAANTKLVNIIAYRNKLQSSSYWFMDSGYKYRYDKYNDKYRWVPMNGDSAGLCSRVEPYESPAGYRRGVIKNVVKLAFNPNKAQRDQLYSSSINPIMSQVGQGILLFGDKTGQGYVSSFDRINVRRLFIAVEKAIATAAQSFLFELNDEFTQTQFKNIVEPFLREIQGRRGITDFRVISDATVNTPEVIDQNKFKANIFIKPARSINVIELTFVATRTGIEFDEIVGSLT